MSEQVRTIAELLHQWVTRSATEPGRAWLEQALARCAPGCADRDLWVAIGMAPRKLGKVDLPLAVADRDLATHLRPGWDPTGWSLDQAARLALLLSSFDGDAGRFAARLEELFRHSDIGEQITFYRGLPLYPEPDRYLARAGEGARSGMRPVFEAVAHRNPYPRERFTELAWNHMVVKAFFIDSTLAPIQGLDARRNPILARMLCDLAHERWAAGRPVSPELWRCVGPHADAAGIEDMAKVLTLGNERERRAAALALSECPALRAEEILATAPELAQTIAKGELGWDDIRLPGGDGR